jgi:hypothetical protein
VHKGARLFPVDRHERTALIGLGLASLILPFVPLLGLEHVIFTKPVLMGFVVALFVRRFAVPRKAAVLVAVLPFAVLTSIGLLRSAGTSARYRAIVWLVLTAMYVIASIVGGTVGHRRLAADRSAD